MSAALVTSKQAACLVSVCMSARTALRHNERSLCQLICNVVSEIDVLLFQNSISLRVIGIGNCYEWFLRNGRK